MNKNSEPKNKKKKQKIYDISQGNIIPGDNLLQIITIIKESFVWAQEWRQNIIRMIIFWKVSKGISLEG